jgi:hypothetical protein
MSSARAVGTGLLVLFAGGIAACGGSGEGTTRDPAVGVDTGAMGGLTPEEIRARAEPMSPEKAESLGIVDTTIHVEAHENPDSLPITGRPTNP